MRELASYLGGTWQIGSGDAIKLYNPTNGSAVATLRAASSLNDALNYGRNVGGPALRALSYAQRGELLKATAAAIYDHREELLNLAVETGGNTRGDAKFDIDGASGVLTTYIEIAGALGDRHFSVEDESAAVYAGSKVRAQHVLLPRHGVAVHINAFNFPAWGLIGKLAVSILAGMPVLAKPATATCLVAHRIAEVLVERKIFPEGAFQLLIGPAGDLLEHLGPQDVVAITGSAATGATIRKHPRILEQGVRVNVEADSVNAVVIGADVETGTELFDLVVRDLAVEMTQKAGQKCTATRRILVPTSSLPTIREALCERLSDLAKTVGDPNLRETRMGPLASAAQLADARRGIADLQKHAKIVFGDPQRQDFIGVEAGQGFFLEPILLEANEENALDSSAQFHHHEVFGPVATLLPFDGSAAQAATIVGFGAGSLVTTVYTNDRDFLRSALLDIGPHVGRLVFAEEKSARGSMSPGCVFAVANHGGPGRAGGGAELGGKFGLELYMQRTAIQGGASQLARLLGASSTSA
jgi:oxepin-CoA hydrolase/3-oxo-5,6-dehydrosuberyl-CoA semialdehyde dehydrogenase